MTQKGLLVGPNVNRGSADDILNSLRADGAFPVPSYYDEEQWIELYNLTREDVETYTSRLLFHIQCVQEAALYIVGTVPLEQVARHDLSKWDEAQFPHYARKFVGDGGSDGWIGAWRDHLFREWHHWQAWMIPNSPWSSTPIYMPRNWSDEMVADWLGAGKSYTGSWDMTEWLKGNIGRITLHPKTIERVNDVLINLGYIEVVEEFGDKWGQDDRPF